MDLSYQVKNETQNIYIQIFSNLSFYLYSHYYRIFLRDTWNKFFKNMFPVKTKGFFHLEISYPHYNFSNCYFVSNMFMLAKTYPIMQFINLDYLLENSNIFQAQKVSQQLMDRLHPSRESESMRVPHRDEVIK